MTTSINHPAIPNMLTKLTNNHKCSGAVVEYHAPVVKGAVMPLCQTGKEQLDKIHPLTKAGKKVNFDMYKTK